MHTPDEITVPTVGTDARPYYLSEEYRDSVGAYVVIARKLGDEESARMIAVESDGRPDALRQAWEVCTLLNDAHEREAGGEPERVTLDVDTIRRDMATRSLRPFPDLPEAEQAAYLRGMLAAADIADQSGAAQCSDVIRSTAAHRQAGVARTKAATSEGGES